VLVKESRLFIKPFSQNLSDLPARYVKVKAKNVGTCPTWHPGAGGKAWIFVDELVIN